MWVPLLAEGYVMSKGEKNAKGFVSTKVKVTISAFEVSAGFPLLPLPFGLGTGSYAHCHSQLAPQPNQVYKRLAQ